MRSSFTPFKHQCFVLRVFEVSSSYTERREVETRMITAGIELGTSRTEGRALINCATLAPAKKSKAISFAFPFLLPLRRLPHIEAKLSAMMITLCRPEG